MKINNNGCALCNSTWGNYHRTIENEELFFCCNVCADIFEKLIQEIKNEKQIKEVIEFDIRGDTRIRTFIVYAKNKKFQGRVTFNKGTIKEITFS